MDIRTRRRLSGVPIADVAEVADVAERARGSLQAASTESLLSEHDLVEVEKAHPRGVTSAQIIQIFQSRGVRLSEATFRKYIQLGLLPRSHRVGTKGKHRGSIGMYPSATIRRINSIKGLMAQSFTIEEIQQRLGAFKQRVDAVEAALDELFKGFERELAQPRFDFSVRRNLGQQVDRARRSAAELMRQVIQIDNEISIPEKTQRVAGEGSLTDM